MTPASPHRSLLGTSATAVVAALLLGLAGSTSSESLPVSRRVLPLELGRQFPDLTALPELVAVEPDPAAATAAESPTGPAVDLRAVTDSYLLSLPFGSEIRRAARTHRVDGLLVASIVEAESSFRPDAVSPKGALGLMQLMPFHFGELDEPFDPKINLDRGTAFLATLERRYEGDVRLTVAAYHAGPGAVSRWGGVPPYESTRLYVGRVLDRYEEHQETLAQLAAPAVTAVSAAAGAAQRGS
jgi:soluble lytic murein transglycosylase-like protein